MYAAYILHTCTAAHVTHVCFTHAAHTIHPYCVHVHIQKLAQHHTHSIQAYEEMYSVCVQLFTCSMYAVYKQLHTSCIHVFRCVRPHVHVCGMRVALSQFLCMQHTCNMDVLCVQHVCSVYAQHVQQGSRYMCSTQATFL